MPFFWVKTDSDEKRLKALSFLIKYHRKFKVYLPNFRGGLDYSLYTVDIDLLFKRTDSSNNPPLPDGFGLVPITGEAEYAMLSADLVQSMPPPAAVGSGNLVLWRLKKGSDKIVSVVDTTVQTKKYSLIQSLFTDSSEQDHGYASLLIDQIVSRICLDGRQALYIASELNTASIRVAEKNAFVLEAKIPLVSLR